MKENEYKKMYELENKYWWYVGRRFIIKKILSKYVPGQLEMVVDLGCGTGINLSFLGEFGKKVIGIDHSERAIQYCASRNLKSTQLLMDINQLTFPPKSVGLATMFDVLEHIKDEGAALNEINKVLAEDGLLVLTVPAYQFLWSEHDVALHHIRRYTASRLKKLLSSHNFEVVKCSYITTFSFPLILAYRTLKGLLNIFFPSIPKTSHVQLPNVLNRFLVFLLKIEGLSIQYLNLPFGSTIIAVARRGGFPQR